MSETKLSRWLWVAGLAPVLLSLSAELQDVDATQYADVAARIVRSGRWLELRDIYGPFLNKPPMMMWAQALCMHVFGVDSFAARLPGVGFALLATLGVGLIALELFENRQVAGWAAALFSSSVAVHVMVADPKVDLALTCFTTLAIWAALASRRRSFLMWFAWAFAGAAVLSKGPIGVAIPVLALLPELVRGGLDEAPRALWRRVLAMKPLTGLVIVAAMAAPFYLASAKQTGTSDTIVFHLWNQGVGRLLSSSDWQNNTTPLFFVHTSLWTLMPMVPVLLWSLGRRAWGVFQAKALPPRRGRVLVWWFGLTFVVISAARFRLPQYSFWLAPPAALLAAEELSLLSARALERWRVAFTVISAVVGLGGLTLLVISFPPPVLGGVVLGGVLVSGPLFAWRLGSREPHVMLVAVVTPMMVLFHGWLYPSLLEYQPGRELGALARREDPHGTMLPFLEVAPPFSVPFYAQRDAAVFGPQTIREMVSAGRTRLAVLAPGNEGPLEQEGLVVTVLERYVTYPTSMPHGRFLLASRRAETLGHVELVRLTLK